uniref:Uncharacterized protein n=1 Tax=Corethron hystrix TaxID=216773 RepID=A0A7S1FUK9_9STRA|mmetsp:Transcript_32337/g.74478  ORF Transcript_32337/g.74478 Transcript_32337/m.74478 type:complete len:770 (+) Transcript_32337:233-2542(+)|eukprot:CAMPEP_0113309582 /NCGR_PEP_ID=MMETSP0010_2-20120614/7566_1 /TAXON_ID=216773 ORGANISM="Corethron hystrix, Strain 308" /NCGR_SAMPLE_ID=MMETSP0010_2 /ASSEMBLY_ACC=CAM_ASM_000155 /LENGTH=769 /DNA_ID=CAMNT_0000164859 /DNA_START=155 /DNA_END=2464 /DNA_ORIENTATION=- /assembly_acc=CAM_ASM_000155
MQEETIFAGDVALDRTNAYRSLKTINSLRDRNDRLAPTNHIHGDKREKKKNFDNLVSLGCCFQMRRRSITDSFIKRSTEENKNPTKALETRVSIATTSHSTPKINHVTFPTETRYAETMNSPCSRPMSRCFQGRGEITDSSHDVYIAEGRDRLSGTETTSLSSHDLTSDSDPLRFNMKSLVFLLVEPILRRYQLIQMAYNPDSSTVGDIVRFMTMHSTEFAFRKQKYVSLCRPFQEGVELLNCILVKKYLVEEDEILIAVPRGWSASACCKLAQPILDLNKVKSFMDRVEQLLGASKGKGTDPVRDSSKNINESKAGYSLEPNALHVPMTWNSDSKVPKEVLIQYSAAANFPSHTHHLGSISLQLTHDLDDDISDESDDTASTLTMPTIDADSENDIKVSLCNEFSSCSSIFSGATDNLLKIIALVMEPVACHFELLLLQVNHETTVVGAIDQLRIVASKKLFGKQLYVGLCRIDGREILNNVPLATYGLDLGEVLVAIPKGLSALSCSLLAKPILRDSRMRTVLIKMTKSIRENIDKENKKMCIERQLKKKRNEIYNAKAVFKRSSSSCCSFSSFKDTVVSLPSITEDNAMDTSAENAPDLMSTAVLVMNPLTRRFALLQLKYRYQTSLVAGVLSQTRAMLSKQILKKQSFIGLCKLNGQELVNCFKMREYNLFDGELIIAIPKGLGGATCVQLAQPILKYPQVKSLLKFQMNQRQKVFKTNNGSKVDWRPFENGIEEEQQFGESEELGKLNNFSIMQVTELTTLASF